METIKTAPFTMFGETRDVELVVLQDGVALIESDTWDEEYWVEVDTEWYGLNERCFGGKKVRVVTRKQWLDADPIWKEWKK